MTEPGPSSRCEDRVKSIVISDRPSSELMRETRDDPKSHCRNAKSVDKARSCQLSMWTSGCRKD